MFHPHKYKSTKQHTNVDVLSRLPVPCCSEDLKHEDPINVFNVSQIETLPVTYC